LVRFAAVEAQAQAVAAQQHQFAIDAGKGRERRVAFDLGDRQSPVPFIAIWHAANLARPAGAVAPARAAVIVGGNDARKRGGRHCASVAGEVFAKKVAARPHSMCETGGVTSVSGVPADPVERPCSSTAGRASVRAPAAMGR
jgi:hypothetical protein